MAITLLIGFYDAPTFSTASNENSQKRHLTIRQFMTLEQTIFDGMSPRLVLSPLISNGYDALEFATRLHTLGFRGRYRALVDELPDTTIINREIRRAAPSIKFGVTQLGQNGLSRFRARL